MVSGLAGSGSGTGESGAIGQGGNQRVLGGRPGRGLRPARPRPGGEAANRVMPANGTPWNRLLEGASILLHARAVDLAVLQYLISNYEYLWRVFVALLRPISHMALIRVCAARGCHRARFSAALYVLVLVLLGMVVGAVTRDWKIIVVATAASTDMKKGGRRVAWRLPPSLLLGRYVPCHSRSNNCIGTNGHPNLA